MSRSGAPSKEVFARLRQNSVVVPGKETKRLAQLAGDHHLTLVMGVNERVETGPGNAHSVPERFHKIARKVIGLAIVQGHRTVNLLPERLGEIPSQLTRFLQIRARSALTPAVGIIPNRHVPARREAVGRNLMSFDRRDAQRLSHEPTLSQTRNTIRLVS